MSSGNIASGSFSVYGYKIMAQSIEEIKAELEAPTHRVVNGEQVDLTAEEIEATLNTWAENERARQLDVEANGYKYARETAYRA